MSVPSTKNQRRYIRRMDGIMESQIDNEKILFETSSGQTFALTSVGTTIWDFISESRDLDSICQRLMNQYDVSADQCLQETTVFLGELMEKNLVSLD